LIALSFKADVLIGHCYSCDTEIFRLTMDILYNQEMIELIS